MEASKPYLAIMSKEVCILALLDLLRLPLLLRRGLPRADLDLFDFFFDRGCDDGGCIPESPGPNA